MNSKWIARDGEDKRMATRIRKWNKCSNAAEKNLQQQQQQMWWISVYRDLALTCLLERANCIPVYMNRITATKKKLENGGINDRVERTPYHRVHEKIEKLKTIKSSDSSLLSEYSGTFFFSFFFVSTKWRYGWNSLKVTINERNWIIMENIFAIYTIIWLQSWWIRVW